VRRRLDVEMVRRGLVSSRTQAAEAIRSGQVAIAGRPAAKAGTLVLPDESITLAAASRRFVSRGGEKLEAALDRFAIDVAGRMALDVGASTGGFTDCLLQRGAAHVVAADVGYGQLDWRLREDPRVTTLDRTNARDLTPGMLPYAPDLLTADVSFISLRLILPAASACAAEDAAFVLLVKPQFEAGRGDVRPGGVVSDPDVWRRVIRSIGSAGEGAGVRPAGLMASPLVGPAGNVEFLLWGTKGPTPQGVQFDLAVATEEAVEAGRDLAGRRGQS
jgi:23S rRNA (cytidine1920-2'-O)/16S rRNA (cytidine1409-2'-O)-methyltransferase